MLTHIDVSDLEERVQMMSFGHYMDPQKILDT